MSEGDNIGQRYIITRECGPYKYAFCYVKVDDNTWHYDWDMFLEEDFFGLFAPAGGLDLGTAPVCFDTVEEAQFEIEHIRSGCLGYEYYHIEKPWQSHGELEILEVKLTYNNIQGS